MKSLKLLFTAILSIVLLSSCVMDNRATLVVDEPLSLNDVVSSYDIWYVDIHRTRGTAEVPFLQRAFTISFDRGIMYGNNNIVDIGRTGNGYGIQIGSYGTFDDILETSHRQGYSDFRVIQLSPNEIRLDDVNQNVSYYLVGYYVDEFDYDKLFYDNIEFFLQEYVAWERVDARGGSTNPFDNEHFLEFTPENDNTFRSSGDRFGTTVDNLIWDYVGGYTIEDYSNVDDVKFLKLYYDNNDVEKFDVTIIDDGNIRLTHLATNTQYDFTGRGFIQYLRGENKTKTSQKVNRNNDRKRRKIARKSREK